MNRIFIFPLPFLFLVSCTDQNRDNQIQKPSVEEAESNSVTFSYNAGLNIGASVPKHIKVKLGSNETDFESILRDGPVVLIFNRSVEWCANCQVQLKQIGGIVGDIEERGYRLLALSYDDPDIQRKFLESHNLGFQMLSDQNSVLIDGFGLRDPQFTEGRAVGVPYATVMVIGDDGRVKAKSVSGDHKKRPAVEQFLAIIDSL